MSRFLSLFALMIATASSAVAEELYHLAPYGRVPVIAVGDTRAGVLEEKDRSERVDGSRYDDWGIRLSRGQCIEATMSTPTVAGSPAPAPGTLDPFLVIGRFDKGKFIYEKRDDDGAGARNARARLCASREGVYFIRANAYDAGSYGAYTLEVKPYPDRAAGVPVPIMVGSMAYGALDPTTDARLRTRGPDGGEQLYDLYQFEASPGDWYVVNLRSMGFDYTRRQALDLVLEAGTAPSGAYEPLTIFDNDNDGGGSYNARLLIQPPANASIIYLRASGLRRSDAGSYTISVERVPTNAGVGAKVVELKHGKRRDDTLTLSDPQRGESRLYDRYKLEGRKGYTYTVDLGAAQFDPLLEVYADTPLGPRLVERNDDAWPYVAWCTEQSADQMGSGCLNSRVEITFQRSGSVYLDVTSPNPMSTGPYTITTSKGRKAR